MLIPPAKADSTSRLAQPEHTAKTSAATVVNSLSNTKLRSYSANYSVSFGQKDTNQDIFAKMKDVIRETRKTGDKKKRLKELHELFDKLSETPRRNCLDLVKRFEKEGLTFDDYLVACAKRDRLFYHSPEKLERNIREFVKTYADKGLTVKKYLKFCLMSPSIISERPENIVSYIEGVAHRFRKEGLTTDKYLTACTQAPALFYQRPHSIERKVRQIANKFKVYDIRIRDILRACLSQSDLFYKSPESVENKVKTVFGKFKSKGLTMKDYLECCLKKPQLFFMKFETVIEHINILLFCNKNARNPLTPKEFWANMVASSYNELTYSSPRIMLKKLIIPQIAGDGPKPAELQGATKLPEKLRTFLNENPNKKFTLNVRGTKKELALLENCIKELLSDMKNPFKIIHLR